MLSSLLQTIKPSQGNRQPSAQFESFTEDSHTFSLLFPDGNGPRRYALDGHSDLLSSSRTSFSSNDWPLYNDVDLVYPRDIRILIAQAGTSFANATLVFDSKSTSAADSPKSGAVRHARTSSKADTAARNLPAAGRGRGTASAATVSSIPESPVRHHRRTSSAFSTSGAFERRARRTSVSSTHGSIDSSADHNRDKDDIERIALSCMFENATSSYKGTSNKVHIVPLASKPYENSFMSQSLGSDLPGSFMKPQLVRKPSALSKSHMPDDISAPQMSMDLSKTVSQGLAAQNEGNRRTVLITRTFSLSWPEDDGTNIESSARTLEEDTDDSLHRTDQLPLEQGRQQSRILRSPMYAVSIVLRLPVQNKDVSPSISRSGTFGKKTVRRDSSSRSATSFGSFESERRALWQGAGSWSGLDSMASFALGTDVDDRVDLIGHHWDVLSRTLSTLQALAQRKLLELLRPMSRTTRNLRVAPNALCRDDTVSKAIADCGLRVVRGMRLPRARTGHGLWPAWREEARWLSIWSSKRDDNHFLLVLLCAYLGMHTDWIPKLAPKSYRKKFRDQQRMQDLSRMSLPNRTVIISADKMAARRLIFILGAFLPTSHPSRPEGPGPRPQSSSSFRAYSQSPPTNFLLSREQSLRRTINKPGRLRTHDLESQASSITITSDSVDDRTETDTIRRSGSGSHSRRPSDARSVKLKLSMLDIDPLSQKSSAIASPTTPDAVLVKPHFARQVSFGAEPLSAHSRSSSSASAHLLQPLQKTSSMDPQARLWNPFGKLFGTGQRRASDVPALDISQTTDEGLVNRGNRIPSKLEQMISEGHGELQNRGPQQISSTALQDQQDLSAISQTGYAVLADAAQPIDVPLKMSVNRDDGIIDVEIPLGEFGSPTILSPTLPGDVSSSSFGDSSFGQNSLLVPGPRDTAQAINVSGWLDKIHPDFSLQAVKPYADLSVDIKEAMSAEPTPLHDDFSAHAPTVFERWTNVCSTLVVDTDKLTVKRLHLRRLVCYVRNATTVSSPSMSLARSHATTVHHDSSWSQPATASLELTEFTLAEQFDEELLTSSDHDFADVMEKITGMSTNSSRVQSTSTSRSSSRRGRAAAAGEETPEHDGENARDCERLIIGRLESIIASEISTMHQEEQQKSTQATQTSASVRQPLNSLRSGVRRWLENVDALTHARGNYHVDDAAGIQPAITHQRQRDDSR